MDLHFAGGPNSTNVIQVTGSLAPPVLWQSVSTNVADSSGGLRIVDVTNSSLPAELGSYASANDVTAVAVDGKRAYIADDILGLVILDVSNPALPAVLGSAAQRVR